MVDVRTSDLGDVTPDVELPGGVGAAPLGLRSYVDPTARWMSIACRRGSGRE